MTTLESYFERGAAAEEELAAFWTALGESPAFADVIDGEVTAAEVRDATYLTSAGVL